MQVRILPRARQFITNAENDGVKRIELEEPYSKDWNTGFLSFNIRTGRWYVQLLNGETRSLTTYARYLMSVHLGRYLEPDEQVDHIDENCQNDNIDNLQILSVVENNRKHLLQNDKYSKYVTLICPECSNGFQIDERSVRSRSKNNERTFCSHSCSATYYASNGRESSKTKSENEIQMIRVLREQGLSSYKISEELGISRNTVMKYWKKEEA